MIRAAVVFAAFAFAFAAGVAAQPTYPTKPIRVIVGFPPGGGGEQLTRAVGQKLTEAWGQPIVIDNKPGASGNVAAGELVRAPADGHTLLYFPAALAVNPSLFPKLPYDLARDFTPITMLATFPLVLFVNNALPARTPQELIAYAKANPGRLNFASIGNASPPHLAGELFKMTAGLDMVHVPYKGSAPAQTDLLSGQVQLMFDTAVSGMPHARAGRVRALAVTTAQRSPLLPELPSLAESGLRGYDLAGWGGIVGPAGMPREIVTRLHAEIARALRAPDVSERLNVAGGDAGGMPPDAFARFILEDAARWREIVVRSGAKLD